ncbi:MAG: hypothetical protein OQJ81_10130 [Melioribacteraceae bacterium]|jgi:hypothetical protein|nr:hypothetical protein [Melioribacteraceae bacterium]
MRNIILFLIFGYLAYKLANFIKRLFAAHTTDEASQKVHGAANSKTKIDKKDVIDAQFEEIEIKDKSASTE